MVYKIDKEDRHCPCIVNRKYYCTHRNSASEHCCLICLQRPPGLVEKESIAKILRWNHSQCKGCHCNGAHNVLRFVAILNLKSTLLQVKVLHLKYKTYKSIGIKIYLVPKVKVLLIRNQKSCIVPCKAGTFILL